jgi:aflatoxin B1 aldehyde reductase
LEGIDALYKSGAFRRFGISNFDADQTKEVLRICRERGFVLPTVYQGNYNAVGRLAETQLFPILRENNSKWSTKKISMPVDMYRSYCTQLHT